LDYKIIYKAILFTLALRFPQIVNILILPLITPFLTLKDYGVFGLISAYLIIFQILVPLGLPVVLQNTYFEKKETFNQLWANMYGLMTLFSIIMSILCCVTLYLIIPSEESSNYFLLAFLLSGYLILSPIETIATNFFVLKGKPYPILYRSVLTALIAGMISFYTIKILGLGYLGWFISMFSTNLILTVSYIKIFWSKFKIFPKIKIPSKREIKEYSTGFKVIPHNLSLYFFNTSDRAILDLFKINISDIGLYSQGYSIGANGMILINGIFSAFTPKIQTLYRKGDPGSLKQLREIFKMILIVTLGIIFVISLWMKEIYFFLFRNPELQIGYPIGLIILASSSFWLLYSFASIPLFIKKKTEIVFSISLVGAITNVLLNVLFIPQYGIWAAALSTYLSYLIIGISIFFYRRYIYLLEQIFEKPLLFYLMATLAIVILTIIAYLFKDATIPVKLSISVISIFSFLLFFYFQGNKKNIQ